MRGSRERFTDVVSRALDENDRLALVLAEIGVQRFEETGAVARHPDRIVNVGIREQLMISVAGGMALEGMRPVVHTYAPFLVERPFEQIKLDLGHQDVGAVLVSIGASYDASAEGRTHQAPGDVALLSTLPGWTVHVPGHPDEVERLLVDALAGSGRVYLRLSDEANPAPYGRPFSIVRQGSPGCPLVVAVGPTLDEVVAATSDLDVTVAYSMTPRPFDVEGLWAALTGTSVILVEPYLAGTSAAAVADAFRDRPIRLLALGVREAELRRYGSPAEHRAAHGLDSRGLRASIATFTDGAWTG